MAHREAMGLIAHLLQQIESLFPSRDTNRLRCAGQVDLLHPLGQACHRDDNPSAPTTCTARDTCPAPPSTSSKDGG